MTGQISFDFLLSIVFALLLLQSLLAFSDTFLLNQEKIVARMQAKQIIDEINQFLLYSKFLNNGTDVFVYHEIPKIYLSSSPGFSRQNPISCNITIGAAPDPQIITVTVDNRYFPNLGKEKITETISNMANIVPPNSASTECGRIIALSKTELPTPS